MGHLDVNAVSFSLPDGRRLLRDVTFRVGEGAKVALIGPNGTGKTTLLRILAGDLTASDGAVTRSGGLGVMRQFIGKVRDDTTVRHQLTHGWEMVTASALPLINLSVMTFLGAEVRTAVLGALVCSTILLCVAGWSIGRGGRLTGRERLASTLVAGMFGALFIILKTQLH